VDRLANSPGRTITLTGAWVFGIYFVIAFTFRRFGVSQDTLTIVAGVLAYAFLAFVLVVGLIAWRRRPGGVEQAVSGYLEGHPTVTGLLGEPIEVAVPTSVAQAKAVDGGQVNVSAVVSGPRGNADADLVLARLGRRWEVLDGSVEHDGERHALSADALT
jgi:Cytochrome oxidase complex assembly protein 1